MKVLPLFLLLISLVTLTLANENHAQKISAEILSLKEQIVQKSKSKDPNDFIFLSFWDFDGTLLHGDCTEGLYENGTKGYKGLAQIAIEKGFSKIYKPHGGFGAFWKDYLYFQEHIGDWFAYPYVGQMLYGSDIEAIETMVQKQFEEQLQNFYYNSSLQILNTLETHGVRNYIVSASADIFVEGAASSLGLAKERFHGIELVIEDKKLTNKINYPLTWAEGKREKIEQIVAELHKSSPNKTICILAAFGNSYGTDGAFMRYVKKGALPYKEAVAVMINGGDVPKEYEGLFTRVVQKELYALGH